MKVVICESCGTQAKVIRPGDGPPEGWFTVIARHEKALDDYHDYCSRTCTINALESKESGALHG